MLSNAGSESKIYPLRGFSIFLLQMSVEVKYRLMFKVLRTVVKCMYTLLTFFDEATELKLLAEKLLEDTRVTRWNFFFRIFQTALSFISNTAKWTQQKTIDRVQSVDSCKKERRSNIVWLVAFLSFQCHWPIKSSLLSLKFHRKNCFVRRLLFIVKKKNYSRKWTSHRYIGKPGEKESKTRIEEVYVNDHQHRL